MYFSRKNMNHLYLKIQKNNYSHVKMFKAGANQLPFFTGIRIGSLRKWPKNMIIDEPKDSNKSEKKKDFRARARKNMN